MVLPGPHDGAGDLVVAQVGRAVAAVQHEVECANPIIERVVDGDPSRQSRRLNGLSTQAAHVVLLNRSIRPCRLRTYQAFKRGGIERIAQPIHGLVMNRGGDGWREHLRRECLSGRRREEQKDGSSED
jgi:hypothetical protein